MKLRSILNYVSTIAVAAGLPLGFSTAHAAAAPLATDPGQTLQFAQIQIQIPGPASPARIEWGDEKRRKLRHAYWILEHAKGDYHGHRGAAMEHIRKAADILGMELHGDGYAEGPHSESQAASDDRLLMAKHILEDVAGESGGREHEHLHIAIRELDHALEVR